MISNILVIFVNQILTTMTDEEIRKRAAEEIAREERMKQFLEDREKIRQEVRRQKIEAIAPWLDYETKEKMIAQMVRDSHKTEEEILEFLKDKPAGDYVYSNNIPFGKVHVDTIKGKAHISQDWNAFWMTGWIALGIGIIMMLLQAFTM